MSRLSPNGSGQFRVSLPGIVREGLKALHREEELMGRGREFIQALRAINERLKNDPLQFGEPLYHLNALQLGVRQAVIRPLVVDFAVHDVEPIVFVRGFKLLH